MNAIWLCWRANLAHAVAAKDKCVSFPLPAFRNFDTPVAKSNDRPVTIYQADLRLGLLAERITENMAYTHCPNRWAHLQ
jgi:hypothetical protein